MESIWVWVSSLLELNAFEPVIFYALFQSIEAIGRGVDTLINNCILGITANADRCKALVDGSIGIIPAICPHVGYQPAADAETGADGGAAQIQTPQLLLGPVKADNVPGHGGGISVELLSQTDGYPKCATTCGSCPPAPVPAWGRSTCPPSRTAPPSCPCKARDRSAMVLMGFPPLLYQFSP